MMQLRAVITVLVLAWLVLGQTSCGGQVREQEKGPAGPGPGTAPSGQEGTPAGPTPGVPASAQEKATPGQPATGVPPGGGAPGAEGLAQLARQDLSRRAGVPEGEIATVSTAAETWRDASLGCPEPGRVYAQVLTPGYRIVLEARGQRHEYHTDSARVILCQGP